MPPENKVLITGISESIDQSLLEAATGSTIPAVCLVEVFEGENQPCEELIDEAVEKLGIKGLPVKENREMVLKLKVGHFGIVNRNNRYYPPDIGRREVKKLEEKINARATFSNDQHPRREKGADGKVKMVDLPTFGSTTFIPYNISVNEAGEVFSVGVVPKTDAGKNYAAVIRAGGRPGVSTRGNGSLERKKIKLNEKEEKEVDVVKEDFRLDTFDTVIDQSVADAGIRMISESQQPQNELPPEQEKPPVVESKQCSETQIMKLSEWMKQHADAAKSLFEALNSGDVTGDEVKSQAPKLYEGLCVVVGATLEEGVTQKLVEEFGTYCDKVRNQIKATELEEAKAEGIAEFLQESGIDSDFAKVLAENPELAPMLKQSLAEALEEDGGEETPAGDGKDESITNLGETKEIKELNESVNGMKAQLFEAQKGQKIAELALTFPYGKEAFDAIKKNLNECESLPEMDSLYENQVSLLKAAKVPESKKVTGQARFVAVDSVVNESQEAAPVQSGDLDESEMLKDAAQSLKEKPAKPVAV